MQLKLLLFARRIAVTGAVEVFTLFFADTGRLPRFLNLICLGLSLRVPRECYPGDKEQADFQAYGRHGAESQQRDPVWHRGLCFVRFFPDSLPLSDQLQ
jgi:hypothetical protein